MSEWKEYTLGNIASFRYGKMIDHKQSGRYPVHSGYRIVGFTEDYNYEANSILIVARGVGGSGDVKMFPYDCWVTNLSIIAEFDPKYVHNKYFYYLHVNNNLSILDSGSAQSQITIQDLQRYKLKLPSLNIQRNIASILSSLDDKIDLLHRQNKTLEQLAETLFRQWFIEDAKNESAQKLFLGDLIYSVSDTHHFPNDKIIFLNTSDIYLGEVLNHSHESSNSLPGQAKKSIKLNDILFSEIRPANGRYAFVNFDATNYVVSTKLMVLRAKNNITASFIYFYLTHPYIIEWLQMLAESRSGTFPQITFDQIKELKLNIQSTEIMNYSNNYCKSALDKILSNLKQIRTLIQVRDALLPKLMSGEIKLTK